MRVLVTGGTGVVGTSTITALLQRGHAVRLLSRHADRDVRQWSQGVSPWPGDVAVEASVRGSADGCDAIVHIAGIIEEHPPESTFERVNVEGTRHVVREAGRAGVATLVYISSLGAQRGRSGYHRSKSAGEDIVRSLHGGYVIVRPGAVYGPGDDHLSVLLRAVRALPAVPIVGDGDREFQPIWHEDAAEAIAMCVERDDLRGRTLDLAGPERTSQRDLLHRLRAVTGREPLSIPVPDFLASLGVKAAEAVGISSPISEGQLTMLSEGNTLEPTEPNALVDVFGIQPTPLAEGLRKLADAGLEQLPSDGVGALQRKRFWADIRGSALDADGLFELVRAHFGALMPRLVDAQAEPAAPPRLDEGATLTLGLPLRGHIQVRVAEVAEHRITMLTLEGHPLAGAIRLLVEVRGDALRFEIQVYDRAANVVDLIMLRTLGDRLQDANWRQLVSNVVQASGGSGSVEHHGEALDDEQSARVDEWLEELTLARKRDEASV